jgi:hypothetical protein
MIYFPPVLLYTSVMMVYCIQAPETKSMHLCLTFTFSLSMSINTGPGKVSEGRIGIPSCPSPGAIKWQQQLVYGH